MGKTTRQEVREAKRRAWRFLYPARSIAIGPPIAGGSRAGHGSRAEPLFLGARARRGPEKNDNPPLSLRGQITAFFGSINACNPPRASLEHGHRTPGRRPGARTAGGWGINSLGTYQLS